MNYKLIHDEEKLQQFLNFLPDLLPDESYFIILIARRKWAPENTIPPAVKLKREAVKKEKIISTIRQWEVEKGLYKSNGIDIEQDNLGVYISPNPKDQRKATFLLLKECANVLESGKQGINIKSMANDIIQTSNGTKHFLDIDVDIKEGEDPDEIADYIKGYIPGDHLTFVKTSGGFHCLIRLGGLKTGSWYQDIKNHRFQSDLNILSHDLMPLVACNQGKFVPHVVPFILKTI
jgi:hypothetical protein